MTVVIRTQATRLALAAMLSIALLAVPLAGCTKASGSVAATVNGTEVTVAALDAEVAKLRLQSPYLFGEGSGVSEVEIREALLDELINRELLTQKAKELGIEVSEEEIDGEMEIIQANYGSEDEFTAALEGAGFTIDTAREQVRWQLINEYILVTLDEETAVTDAEVRAYYDENQEEYNEGAAKRASHILFAPEDEDLARDVLAQLKAGADFAELAKEHSTDGSAQEGGDLGWPTVQYVPEFEAAVTSLDKGEMTDNLVETQYGWHIIKVTDVREDGVAPFEQVEADIRAQLEDNKRYNAQTEMIESLRTAAEIETLDPVILEAKTSLPADEAGDAPAGDLLGETVPGEGADTGGVESE